MRRRSAGNMVHRHNGNAEFTFSSSRSQPNVLQRRLFTTALSHPTREGHHIYPSASLSDGVEDSVTLEPPSLSEFGNNDTVSEPSTIPLSSHKTSTSTTNDDLHTPTQKTDSCGGCQVQLMVPCFITAPIDCGHHGLIPAVGTTTKFTHKWPMPRMLKLANRQIGSIAAARSNNPSQIATPSLEEGHVLKIHHIVSWTIFKWMHFLSVLSVFAYGCACLIMVIMTWFNTWKGADVMYVADGDILVLITLTGALLLCTSLVGITGIFLNSRPILAAYGLLLWPAMTSLLAIGYISYRRYSLSLDHKLNFNWSRYYTPAGRRIIQDSLQCCGFYSTMHEAAPSQKCYLRAALPGCKAGLFDFERANLRGIWRSVFSLLPLHLLNILISLLCANHITATFGKGVTPPLYRLSPGDVKTDADKILGRTYDGSIGIGGMIRPDCKQEGSFGDEKV